MSRRPIQLLILTWIASAVTTQASPLNHLLCGTSACAMPPGISLTMPPAPPSFPPPPPTLDIWIPTDQLPVSPEAIEGIHQIPRGVPTTENPEPATWAMLASGVALLLFRRKRFT